MNAPGLNRKGTYFPNIPIGDWHVLGSCATTDPEIFFPNPGESVEPAKRICETYCPVIDECLSYALEAREPYGVWGGLSVKERDALIRATPATGVGGA